jgi:hypothetical protein
MNAEADARDKLLLLTAALFAVRLFRTDPAQLGATASASVSTNEKLEQWAQADREANARAAAADAAAIMAAVSVVNL